jgi:hypothetical protein
MKIKTIELTKKFKIGLPNYSSMDVGCGMTFELGEQEEPDYAVMWDEVNYQLFKQTGDIDPDWIKDVKEYKNFFKISIKQKK